MEMFGFAMAEDTVKVEMVRMHDKKSAADANVKLKEAQERMWVPLSDAEEDLSHRSELMSFFRDNAITMGFIEVKDEDKTDG
jgi:hypothetical protein